MIVELKAISGELAASEEQQLRKYMTILNVKRGMLINFQQPGRKGQDQIGYPRTRLANTLVIGPMLSNWEFLLSKNALRRQ
jgi:hypothetical protein